jgi:hypothetical protein
MKNPLIDCSASVTMIDADTEARLDDAAEAGSLGLLRSIIENEQTEVDPEDLNSLLLG